MLDDIRFQFALWKLNRLEDKIAKLYDSDLKAAYKAGKRGDDLEEIKSAKFDEHLLIEDDRENLLTRHFLKIAHRYYLPVRDDDESLWTESSAYQSRVLSEKGVTQVKSAIRLEKRARWEENLVWLPGASGITGIIGSLTALVLALYQCSRN